MMVKPECISPEGNVIQITIIIIIRLLLFRLLHICPSIYILSHYLFNAEDEPCCFG